MKEEIEDQIKNKLYFSAFSGDIYEVSIDEITNLDEGQVPLKSGPKPNCKKCYGRGFTDKNIVNNIYSMCPCLRKHIDFKFWEEVRPTKPLTPVLKNA